VRSERLVKLKIISDIGNRTRDLPVCRRARPTTLPRAPPPAFFSSGGGGGMRAQWHVHKLFIRYKKAYDAFRREALYSLLIEFEHARESN
jgi:hypothetical protein